MELKSYREYNVGGYFRYFFHQYDLSPSGYFPWLGMVETSKRANTHNRGRSLRCMWEDSSLRYRFGRNDGTTKESKREKRKFCSAKFPLLSPIHLHQERHPERSEGSRPLPKELEQKPTKIQN